MGGEGKAPPRRRWRWAIAIWRSASACACVMASPARLRKQPLARRVDLQKIIVAARILLQVDRAIDQPQPPHQCAQAVSQAGGQLHGPYLGLAYHHAHVGGVVAVAGVDLGGEDGVADHGDAQVHALNAALEDHRRQAHQLQPLQVLGLHQPGLAPVLDAGQKGLEHHAIAPVRIAERARGIG